MSITSFAQSGVWDYRNVIIPTVAAAPLAIEGAILAKNLYQNPGYIKDKCLEARDWAVQSFTRQPKEKRATARIAWNAFKVLACLGAMGGAAFASITLLPSSISISAAIGAIVLIGKCFVKSDDYKKQIVGAFTAKAGESSAAARKRIAMNVVKLVLGAALVAGLIYLGVTVISPILTNGFSWNVIQAIPFQTKGVVFAEYAAVGLLHGYLAYSKAKKGDKLGALFHALVGALSFVFPAMYWNTDMRLHHSFYGLLMMAVPYRPVQFLGGAICLDSSLYGLSSLRGYVAPNGKFMEYDFINTIVDNFPLIFNTSMSACILQEVNDPWSKDTKNLSE